MPVCSAHDMSCPVCNLLGCPDHKSRIISRSFPEVTFLICENLEEKERNLLEGGRFKGGALQVLPAGEGDSHKLSKIRGQREVGDIVQENTACEGAKELFGEKKPCVSEYSHKVRIERKICEVLGRR